MNNNENLKNLNIDKNYLNQTKNSNYDSENRISNFVSENKKSEIYEYDESEVEMFDNNFISNLKQGESDKEIKSIPKYLENVQNHFHLSSFFACVLTQIKAKIN